jgi:heme-degrading monooxygenase HmoA
MSVIPTEDRGVVVLIALTVRPEDQQDLVETIRSAGDPARIPGLRSIDLLRSLDGTQVVNQMVWTSADAFTEARAHLPSIANVRAEVQRLVEDATTTVYEVIGLHRSTTSGPG